MIINKLFLRLPRSYNGLNLFPRCFLIFIFFPVVAIGDENVPGSLRLTTLIKNEKTQLSVQFRAATSDQSAGELRQAWQATGYNRQSHLVIGRSDDDHLLAAAKNQTSFMPFVPKKEGPFHRSFVSGINPDGGDGHDDGKPGRPSYFFPFLHQSLFDVALLPLYQFQWWQWLADTNPENHVPVELKVVLILPTPDGKKKLSFTVDQAEFQVLLDNGLTNIAYLLNWLQMKLNHLEPMVDLLLHVQETLSEFLVAEEVSPDDDYLVDSLVLQEEVRHQLDTILNLGRHEFLLRFELSELNASLKRWHSVEKREENAGTGGNPVQVPPSVYSDLPADRSPFPPSGNGLKSSSDTQSSRSQFQCSKCGQALSEQDVETASRTGAAVLACDRFPNCQLPLPAMPDPDKAKKPVPRPIPARHLRLLGGVKEEMEKVPLTQLLRRYQVLLDQYHQNPTEENGTPLLKAYWQLYGKSLRHCYFATVFPDDPLPPAAADTGKPDECPVKTVSQVTVNLLSAMNNLVISEISDQPIALANLISWLLTDSSKKDAVDRWSHILGGPELAYIAIRSRPAVADYILTAYQINLSPEDFATIWQVHPELVLQCLQTLFQRGRPESYQRLYLKLAASLEIPGNRLLQEERLKQLDHNLQAMVYTIYQRSRDQIYDLYPSQRSRLMEELWPVFVDLPPEARPKDSELEALLTLVSDRDMAVYILKQINLFDNDVRIQVLGSICCWHPGLMTADHLNELAESGEVWFLLLSHQLSAVAEVNARQGQDFSKLIAGLTEPEWFQLMALHPEYAVAIASHEPAEWQAAQLGKLANRFLWQMTGLEQWFKEQDITTRGAFVRELNPCVYDGLLWNFDDCQQSMKCVFEDYLYWLDQYIQQITHPSGGQPGNTEWNSLKTWIRWKYPAFALSLAKHANDIPENVRKDLIEALISTPGTPGTPHPEEHIREFLRLLHLPAPPHEPFHIREGAEDNASDIQWLLLIATNPKLLDSQFSSQAIPDNPALLKRFAWPHNKKTLVKWLNSGKLKHYSPESLVTLARAHKNFAMALLPQSAPRSFRGDTRSETDVSLPDPAMETLDRFSADHLFEIAQQHPSFNKALRETSYWQKLKPEQGSKLQLPLPYSADDHVFNSKMAELSTRETTAEKQIEGKVSEHGSIESMVNLLPALKRPLPDFDMGSIYICVHLCPGRFRQGGVCLGLSLALAEWMDCNPMTHPWEYLNQFTIKNCVDTSLFRGSTLPEKVSWLQRHGEEFIYKIANTGPLSPGEFFENAMTLFTELLLNDKESKSQHLASAGDHFCLFGRLLIRTDYRETKPFLFLSDTNNGMFCFSPDDKGVQALLNTLCSCCFKWLFPLDISISRIDMDKLASQAVLPLEYFHIPGIGDAEWLPESGGAATGERYTGQKVQESMPARVADITDESTSEDEAPVEAAPESDPDLHLNKEERHIIQMLAATSVTATLHTKYRIDPVERRDYSHIRFPTERSSRRITDNLPITSKNIISSSVSDLTLLTLRVHFQLNNLAEVYFDQKASHRFASPYFPQIIKPGLEVSATDFLGWEKFPSNLMLLPGLRQRKMILMIPYTDFVIEMEVDGKCYRHTQESAQKVSLTSVNADYDIFILLDNSFFEVTNLKRLDQLFWVFPMSPISNIHFSGNGGYGLENEGSSTGITPFDAEDFSPGGRPEAGLIEAPDLNVARPGVLVWKNGFVLRYLPKNRAVDLTEYPKYLLSQVYQFRPRELSLAEEFSASEKQIEVIHKLSVDDIMGDEPLDLDSLTLQERQALDLLVSARNTVGRDNKLDILLLLEQLASEVKSKSQMSPSFARIMLEARQLRFQADAPYAKGMAEFHRIMGELSEIISDCSSAIKNQQQNSFQEVDGHADEQLRRLNLLMPKVELGNKYHKAAMESLRHIVKRYPRECSKRALELKEKMDSEGAEKKFLANWQKNTVTEPELEIPGNSAAKPEFRVPTEENAVDPKLEISPENTDITEPQTGHSFASLTEDTLITKDQKERTFPLIGKLLLNTKTGLPTVQPEEFRTMQLDDFSSWFESRIQLLEMNWPAQSALFRVRGILTLIKAQFETNPPGNWNDFSTQLINPIVKFDPEMEFSAGLLDRITDFVKEIHAKNRRGQDSLFSEKTITELVNNPKKLNQLVEQLYLYPGNPALEDNTLSLLAITQDASQPDTENASEEREPLPTNKKDEKTLDIDDQGRLVCTGAGETTIVAQSRLARAVRHGQISANYVMSRPREATAITEFGVRSDPTQFPMPEEDIEKLRALWNQKQEEVKLDNYRREQELLNREKVRRYREEHPEQKPQSDEDILKKILWEEYLAKQKESHQKLLAEREKFVEELRRLHPSQIEIPKRQDTSSREQMPEQPVATPGSFMEQLDLFRKKRSTGRP